jgi:hypothetical protein
MQTPVAGSSLKIRANVYRVSLMSRARCNGSVGRGSKLDRGRKAIIPDDFRVIQQRILAWATILDGEPSPSPLPSGGSLQGICCVVRMRSFAIS